MTQSNLKRARDRLAGAPLFGPLVQRVSRLEFVTMSIIAIIAAALFAFVKLGAEVIQGKTRRLDEVLIVGLRTPGNLDDPIGPGWVEEMMRDFTALGGSAVLSLVTLAVTGFLVIARKRHMAVSVAAAVITGMLVSQTLKWGFARPRPDLVPTLAPIYTSSFPSGHAMVSAVVYLTLGVLIARTPIRTAMKAFVLATAVLLTVLVGVSRVYLGVHWPTDVIAGWAGGAAWALLCWLATLALQSRGKVESGQTRPRP